MNQIYNFIESGFRYFVDSLAILTSGSGVENSRDATFSHKFLQLSKLSQDYKEFRDTAEVAITREMITTQS